MDKKPQPEEHCMEPPAYFPPITAQPVVLGNPENSSMAFTQVGGLREISSGQALQPTSFQSTSFHPGRFLPPQIPQMVQECPNPFEAALANQNKLSFRANHSIGCGTGSWIVQIRGAQNQLILPALMTNITVVPESVYRHSSTISFNDPTGKNIITCKQVMDDLTVSAGDRFLGNIRGAPKIFNCCGSTISAEDNKGEIYFKTIDQGSGFTFVQNGTLIATARRRIINRDDFGVEFSASLDTDSKAMIVAVSFYLYVLYHAQTACGCSGTLALTRFLWFILFITFVVPFIITMATAV